jgi:hypothetical protein
VFTEDPANRSSGVRPNLLGGRRVARMPRSRQFIVTWSREQAVTNRLANVGAQLHSTVLCRQHRWCWSTRTGPEASYLARPRLCSAQPCLDRSAALDEAGYRVVRPQ